MTTPTTPEGLRLWDHLPWPQDALAAWMDPGPNPEHHRRAHDEVRRMMPLLARALDRQAERVRGKRRPEWLPEPVKSARQVPWQDEGSGQ